MVSDRTEIGNEMRTFNGNGDTYKQWAARVRAHCQMVNPGWRHILDLIQKDYRALAGASIQISWIDVLAHEDLVSLANELWSFGGP